MWTRTPRETGERFTCGGDSSSTKDIRCNSLPVRLIHSACGVRSRQDTLSRIRVRRDGVWVQTEEGTEPGERLRSDAANSSDVVDAAKRSSLLAVFHDPAGHGLADCGELQPFDPGCRVDFDRVMPLAGLEAGDLDGWSAPAGHDRQVGREQQDRQRSRSAEEPAVACRKSPADIAAGRPSGSRRQRRSDFGRQCRRRGGDVRRSRGGGVHGSSPVNTKGRRVHASPMLPVGGSGGKSELAGFDRVQSRRTLPRPSAGRAAFRGAGARPPSRGAASRRWSTSGG